MKFVIIILIVLAVSKVTLQGSFARKYISDTADSICFYGIIYFFASFIFAYALKCSPPVIAFSLLFGLLTVIFQILNTKAIATIDAGLLFLVYNEGTLVLTTIMGVFLFKDKLTRKQIASIIVGIIGIILINL